MEVHFDTIPQPFQQTAHIPVLPNSSPNLTNPNITRITPAAASEFAASSKPKESKDAEAINHFDDFDAAIDRAFSVLESTNQPSISMIPSTPVSTKQLPVFRLSVSDLCDDTVSVSSSVTVQDSISAHRKRKSSFDSSEQPPFRKVFF
ncbi:hypothetical protein HK100_001046 [Physocladia obscura]|uniref:Uncharacterized protein n=1 Tax=Physocladia obscura TaxID=109957 RepID=A0AAD5SZ74_9FUNG|nr:hypothetical protein HK100_001046 [Physocladia obscura]